MAGLLSKGNTPEPGAAMQPGAMGKPSADQMLVGGEGAGEGESNVSPEEQAQYDQFVKNGMELIYDEKTMPQLMQSLEGAGTPTEGLANALVTVVMRLEDSAKQQGQEISGEVIMHAATELMEQLVELAEAAGVHEFTPEDIESSYLLAIDTYRTARQGKGDLPVDDLKQDMDMMMQADQQGRLDEVVPGISEYAKRAPKPEGQGQPAEEISR